MWLRLRLEGHGGPYHKALVDGAAPAAQQHAALEARARDIFGRPDATPTFFDEEGDSIRAGDCVPYMCLRVRFRPGPGAASSGPGAASSRPGAASCGCSSSDHKNSELSSESEAPDERLVAAASTVSQLLALATLTLDLTGPPAQTVWMYAREACAGCLRDGGADAGAAFAEAAARM